MELTIPQQLAIAKDKFTFAQAVPNTNTRELDNPQIVQIVEFRQDKHTGSQYARVYSYYPEGLREVYEREFHADGWVELKESQV